MATAPRKKDRRSLNVAVPKERRTGGKDRRLCPDCNGPLSTNVRRLAGGSVTMLECVKCGWAKASRQTDADVLVLKLTWALPLEGHQGQLAAVLPQELTAALNARSGDELVISPLVSPVGSLPMKWALTLKRQKKS